MFKTYKASAGSGKTTHLVAEYLSICFSDISKFRSILAITFTNNATAEMKDRIIRTLHRFAFSNDYGQLDPSDKAIYRMILQEMGLPEDKGEGFIRKRSLRLLKEILYDYANFSVSTIDSFFQRLIRAFAIDLDLNMNFRLEIDQEDFFAQTIDLLINKISRKDKAQDFSLSGQVIQLVEHNLEEAGKSNLEKELTKMLYFMYDEEAYVPLKAVEDIDIQELKKNSRRFIEERDQLRNQIITIAQEADTLIRETLLGPEHFYQGKNGPYGWFAKMKMNSETSISGHVLKAAERGYFTKKEDTLPPDFHQQLNASLEKIIALRQEYKMKNVFCQNLDSFMLLFDLKQIMTDIKKHDNLFYLSETNPKIYERIKDEEAPYIYEKLGNRYSYFMIDEFQDTSNMQWKNLLPLIKNALSGINQYHEIGKTILFGDVKQAIYRFRHGDASLFNRLTTREGYQEEIGRNTTDPENFVEQPLNINFRSSKPIVEFNNFFFSFLQRIPDKEGNPLFSLAGSYYKDVEQASPRTSQDGFVSIRFKGEHDGENYFDEQVIHTLFDALKKGFAYKDIAILTKDRASGSRYGRLLASQNIPVISSDSLLLKSSEEIRVLIATLHYLSNPPDELSKTQIIQYLCQRHTMQEYFSQKVKTVKDHSFSDTLHHDFSIDLKREELLALPLYTLIKELLRLYQMNETNPFIICFLDEVLDYIALKNSDITLFLDWWERQEGKLSISSPKEANAITITTIHKAKGLQYPVVIFPLNQYSNTLTKDRFWYKDEQKEIGTPYFPISIQSGLSDTPLKSYYDEEAALSKMDNMNALYVAHTRAGKALYIITGTSGRGNYSVFLHKFIQEHEDLFLHNQEEPDRFWIGNPEYIQNKESKEEPSSTTIRSIHTSAFSPNATGLLFGKMNSFSHEQQLGIEVHDFLATLTVFPENSQEINAAVDGLPDEQASMVKKVLQQVNGDSELQPYFSSKARVMNEVSIIDENGKEYRPDRIAFLDNTVMVIDYKTGKEQKSDEKQLTEYITLLENMGYNNVKGKRIYITDFH